MKNLAVAKRLLVPVALFEALLSYLGKQEVVLRLSMTFTIIITAVIIVLIVDHLPSLSARKALIGFGAIALSIETSIAIGTADWGRILMSLIFPLYILIRWLFSKEGA